MSEKQDVKTRLAAAFAEGRVAHASVDFQTQYCDPQSSYYKYHFPTDMLYLILQPLQHAARLTQKFRTATQDMTHNILVSHAFISRSVNMVISEKTALESFYEVTPEKKDLLIAKKYKSAFYQTILDQHLKTNKLDTLLLSGLVSSDCILSTAYDGLKKGYDVILLDGLVVDINPEDHDNAMSRMTLQGADVIRFEDAIKIANEIKTPAAQTQPDPAPNPIPAFG